MPKTITKRTWIKVAFGDVVRLSRERSNDPLADGLERFVGLEHIEPGNLRIRSWGHISDGTTFTNVFHPGQVLFGKRRAYQRKVAVADFTGVCSGDIYVLEPKNEHLLPELLPFVCRSDGFFEHAIATSAGSLSPRTNWKSLAEFEFALPPMEQQRRIVEVLQAFGRLLEKYRSAKLCLSAVEESLFRALLSGKCMKTSQTIDHERFGLLPQDWSVVSISDVADVAYGISAAVAKNTNPDIGWPILTGANITLDGTIDLSKLAYHPEPSKLAFVLRQGDVLLNWRSGSKAHVGKTALFNLPGDWTFASFILRARPGEDLNGRYLWRLLNYMRKHDLFGPATSQQVNFKMNATYFRNVEIPCPSRAIQDEMVDMLNHAWSAQANLRKRLEDANSAERAYLLEVMSRS